MKKCENVCFVAIFAIFLAIFMEKPSPERSYLGTHKEPHRIVSLQCQPQVVHKYCDRYFGGNPENHTTCTNSFMKEWLVYVGSPRLAFKECRDYKGNLPDEVDPDGCECICVRPPRRIPRRTPRIRIRSRIYYRPRIRIRRTRSRG